MVEGIGSRSPAVSAWRRDPFGAAVFRFSGAPAAFFDEAPVGSAGQGQVVDVGLPAVGPVAVGVMDFAPVGRGGAAGPGTAALGGIEGIGRAPLETVPLS